MSPHSELLLLHTTSVLVLAVLLVSCDQVIRGYLGDRASGAVFDASSPFDILGTGYQRPFELATLRLFNMVGILPKCKSVIVLYQHWQDQLVAQNTIPSSLSSSCRSSCAVCCWCQLHPPVATAA